MTKEKRDRLNAQAYDLHTSWLWNWCPRWANKSISFLEWKW